jgi:hypothetical protein
MAKHVTVRPSDLRARCQQLGHCWRPSSFPGWFLCSRCAMPGICPRCFGGAPLPRWPVPMRCAAHLPNEEEDHHD